MVEGWFLQRAEAPGFAEAMREVWVGAMPRGGKGWGRRLGVRSEGVCLEAPQ